jgi:hypothetical protein
MIMRKEDAVLTAGWNRVLKQVKDSPAKGRRGREGKQKRVKEGQRGKRGQLKHGERRIGTVLTTFGKKSLRRILDYRY